MRLLVVVCALIGGWMSAASEASAQTSYTLWCRGGGDRQQMVVSTNVDASGRVNTSFQISFDRMSTSATAATPPARGECSWLDRPLNGAENGIIRGSFPNVSTSSTLDGGRLTVIDFSGAGDGVRALQTLFNAYRDGRDFRVEVYNDGSVMQVTRVQ
ncbi:hypothetical protein [Candidatus Viadribacter manganicus]|nr:hypothetical protein [Candidatus Viadribacter manganicus]